jgi:glycine cleavage system transcriptional repressor
MATEFFALTAVGPDRPGLMEAISNYLFTRGANVLAARAATLGQEFAVVMLVSVEEELANRLESQIAELSGCGLSCTIRHTAGPRAQGAAGTLPCVLTVQTMDHPGIVQAIAHELAAMGVNIESLDSQVEHAPHTGTAIFYFDARVALPAGLKIELCRQRLDALAKQLNFDLNLEVEKQPRN